MRQVAYAFDWYIEDFTEDDLIDFEANICASCVHLKELECSLDIDIGSSPFMVFCRNHLDKA